MKVLVTDRIHEDGLERLRRFAKVEIDLDMTHDELIEKIPEYDVIIVRSPTKVEKDVIAAADNLDLIVRAGVGLDNIDLAAAEKKGIEVVNTPQAPRVAVAELTVGLMLAFARNISQADKTMKEGKWKKSELVGTELWMKNLGIIGTGRVGRAVARRGKALGMNLFGYDIKRYTEFMEMDGNYVDMNTLLRESDYVTVHVTLTPQTRHIIGERELELMKPSAVLLNVSRGPVVDESALIDALKNEKIAGACIDVYSQEPLPPDSPLLDLPNVILTPHIGASSVEAQRATGVLAARIVERKYEVGELNGSGSGGSLKDEMDTPQGNKTGGR